MKIDLVLITKSVMKLAVLSLGLYQARGPVQRGCNRIQGSNLEILFEAFSVHHMNHSQNLVKYITSWIVV